MAKKIVDKPNIKIRKQQIPVQDNAAEDSDSDMEADVESSDNEGGVVSSDEEDDDDMDLDEGTKGRTNEETCSSHCYQLTHSLLFSYRQETKRHFRSLFRSHDQHFGQYIDRDRSQTTYPR